MLVTVGLIMGLVLVAFAGGHKRDHAGASRNLWAWTGLAVVELILLQNWWLRLLMAGVLINLYRVNQPSSQESHVMKVVGVTAGFLFLQPLLPPNMDTIFLWTLTGIGAVLGIQTLFSLWYVRHKGYMDWIPKTEDDKPCLYAFAKPFGPLTLQWAEYSITPGGYTCGQLMPNWVHALACLATAATCGLTMTGYGWAWGLMPFVLLPILIGVPCALTQRFRTAGSINQCAIHLLALLIAIAMVVNPVGGVSLWLVVFVGVLALAYRQYRRHFPKWVDSGRLEEWYNMLKYWTLLCVDDGSTDGSVDILYEYAKREPRMQVIVEADRGNRGLSAALNHGLHRCQTHWVARMDADDVSLPDRLEKQLAYLQTHPLCIMVGTQGYRLSTDTDAVTLWTPLPLQPCDDDEIQYHLLWRNPFIHTSVIFQRDAVLRVGGYNESLRYCPDFALWRTLGQRPYSRLANLPDRLVGYRVQHAGSLTARYPLRKWWENLRVVLWA